MTSTETSIRQDNVPGITFRYVTDLDNYPTPRATAYGTLTIRPGAFEHSPGEVITFDPEGDGITDAHRALYVIDDGTTARVFYVVGWSSGDDITPRMVMLHPVAGSPDGWRLGPRRAYHLKITRAEPKLSDDYGHRIVPV